MTELPRGTVTLLFTDIEGSTSLLHELGRERYVESLEAHRRLLRDAFGRFGGVEVEMQGDSFLFAFPYARDAVAGAADATRSLAEYAWDGPAIRVRIGLHTGEPAVFGGLYAGLDVRRAARVMDSAHGGQILLSGRTTDLAVNELPRGTRTHALGSYLLNDFGAGEPLTQLSVDGLPSKFPPLRAERVPSRLTRRIPRPIRRHPGSRRRARPRWEPLRSPRCSSSGRRRRGSRRTLSPKPTSTAAGSSASSPSGIRPLR